MAELYHEGAPEFQDRFDTRRLADRLEQVKVHETIAAEDRAFIERMDMLFLATADAEGRPQCSYKGGDAGFVTVLDEHTATVEPDDPLLGRYPGAQFVVRVRRSRSSRTAGATSTGCSLSSARRSSRARPRRRRCRNGSAPPG